MTFQITGLSQADFAPLFELNDEELRARDARRLIADEEGAFPCRVSLADAGVGEELLLVNYEHLPVRSPYRSRYAVYVRRDAEEARPDLGEVPEALARRKLSIRAFDGDDMVRTAQLVDGWDARDAIEAMLADPAVRYMHIHYAAYGCFAARVDRVAD